MKSGGEWTSFVGRGSQLLDMVDGLRKAAAENPPVRWRRMECFDCRKHFVIMMTDRLHRCPYCGGPGPIARDEVRAEEMQCGCTTDTANCPVHR